jgi:hypothetical protein
MYHFPMRKDFQHTIVINNKFTYQQPKTFPAPFGGSKIAFLSLRKKFLKVFNNILPQKLGRNVGEREKLGYITL